MSLLCSGVKFKDTRLIPALLNGRRQEIFTDMGYTIDHLTALMLVIVTTVAVLVMVYTDGYMAHDPGYVRFYAYLSLFSSLQC